MKTLFKESKLIDGQVYLILYMRQNYPRVMTWVEEYGCFYEKARDVFLYPGDDEFLYIQEIPTPYKLFIPVEYEKNVVGYLKNKKVIKKKPFSLL